MDLVLKLREIRRIRNLSQKDVARLSGVGEKTISSFETGQRIGSLKLAQLKRMLKVYGLSEADFFGASVEKEIAPWELNEEQMATQRLLDELNPSLLIPVAPDEPLLLEQGEMLVDRAVGRKTEAVADFTVRGSHAALSLELADELKNVSLPFGQVLHGSLANEQYRR